MMLKLDFVSARGDVLPLTDNDKFYLTNIDGQTAISSALSASVIGGVDGDTVTNVQANPRSIIFDLQIKSDANVEETKREILKTIKVKQYGSLVWTQNDRTVTISGIVEAVNMPRWTNATIMQVTLHCSQPFWEDVEEVVGQISEAIDLHYFTDGATDMLYFPADGIPFGEYDVIRTKNFYNSGDVSVGLEISIVAIDTVTNPIIYDADGNFFGVGYGTDDKKLVLESGDNVVITTHRGHKSVTLNGVNIFDKIKPNSSWLNLQTGDNSFSINSDDDSLSNMSFSIIYKQRYV